MSFIRNKAFISFSLSLLFFVSILINKKVMNSGNSVKNINHSFQRIIQEKENKALKLLVEMQNVSMTDSLFLKGLNADNILSDEGIFLFVKCSNELLYWSDHTVPLEQQMKANGSPAMLKLQNGWYEMISEQKEELVYIALILIKKEYNYQNKYLKNEFHRDFQIGNSQFFNISLEPGKLPVYSSIHNFFLFNIVPLKSYSENKFSILNIGLLLLGLLFFIIGVLQVLKLFQVKEIYRFFALATLLLFIRYILVYLHLPTAWSNSPLFNPELFAQSSFTPSLGELLIHVCLLLILVLLFQHYFSYVKKIRRIIWVMLMGISIFLFGLVNKTTETLIEDSTLSIDIANLYSFDFHSLVAYFIIGVLIFSAGIITFETVKKINSFSFSASHFFLLYLIAALLGGIALFTVNCFTLFAWLPGCILLPLLYVITQKKYSISNIPIFIVLLIAVIFENIYMYKHLSDKELSRLKTFAETLAKERDPIAETIFNPLLNKLKKDSLFITIINAPKNFSEDLKQLLSRKYFNGYWEKYSLTTYLFDSRGEAIIDRNIIEKKDISNLENIIKNQGSKVGNTNFYFINDPSKIMSYLVKIPINSNRSLDTLSAGTLYVELDAKLNAEKIGFPGLLLDNNLEEDPYAKEFSYAKYNNGKLIHQSGNFTYPMSNRYYESILIHNGFTIKDGYKHYISTKNKKDLLIVSTPEKGFFNQLTTFSYLLVVGVATVFTALLLFRLIKKGNNYTATFRSKIQTQLILVLVISLIIFAGGTIINIKQQYQKKNKELLNDKAQSVLIELEQLLKSETSINTISNEYLSYYLSKLSNVFYTDINLFDINGRLMASSRYKLFEQGLVSVRMNADAYKKMKMEQQTAFIHEEQIGELKYLSAYLPFESKENETMAYINLPYFARQDALEDEISAFLVTIINSYLLLFIIAAATTVLIANRITNPLKLISKKLGKIELGKKNEPIEWKQEDEIGQLVKEYNRMIDELSQSAEMLIRSEREGAWREMAKQVAHEIKNPLTPMKLSIQHLQRSLSEDDPEWKLKFDKTAKTIIEQIETLSTIAGEFSDFAKLPQPDFETVNIVPIINQVMELFKNETAEVSFHSELNEALVETDKDHLVRIMNNLIKNSIQAIPSEKLGKVEICLTKTDNNFIISVSDNGSGIPLDLQSRIFMPNFTTKSAGTGLGLAMVKNMVEQSNGNIRFESTEDIGTVFYIRFPLAAKTQYI